MRVLIIRLGAMGDVLHALPAVAALRAARPAWQIDWVVDERWRPLLKSGPDAPVVNAALALPVRAWKQFPISPELPRNVRQLLALRRPGYDVVVDMQGTLRSAVVGRLAGGPQLGGYADPRESPARLFYAQVFQRRETHVVDQGAVLLGQACGVPLAPAAFDLPRNDEAQQRTAAFVSGLAHPSRIALLSPSAGWPAKQWSAAQFAALARDLAQAGWTVLVNNPGGNDGAARQVLAAAADRAQGVSTSIAELIALLRRCSLFVGGDSGPLHLAAALGVPLVALFGPTDPARNGPWGPGPKRILRHPASVTSYRHVAQPDAGLHRIGVADVMAAVHAL